MGLYQLGENLLTILPTPDNSYKYRYIDQEWINLPDGSQLRIIETRQVVESDYCMHRVISGIGSYRGFMGQTCNFLLLGQTQAFRCFYSDKLVYSAVDGNCTLSSTSDIDASEVSIYPNPTQDIE